MSTEGWELPDGSPCNVGDCNKICKLRACLSVIGARSQDVAELGVGPGDLPDGPLVALEDPGERLDAPLLEVEDSHAAVGAAGGEPRAVVVHLGVVDEIVVVRIHGALEGNHGE